MEGAAQAVESLGTEKVVRKDWKAAMEVMGQARWAPEEAVARPLEKLMGEKPEWRNSSPGKEGAGVASQWNHRKSKSGRRPWEESQWLILTVQSDLQGAKLRD